MIIIGIDPDSKANGVAVYRKGKLDELLMMNTVELYDLFRMLIDCGDDIQVHIEDVGGISSNAFNIKSRDPVAVKLKKAEHVGKCKQAQIEVERVCEAFDVKVINHKVSKMWKDADSGKKQFELITDWKCQSNPDKRSAAYFGWLGVTSKRK